MSFLLAKKLIADRKPVTISQHTKDVCNAASALFGDGVTPSRLGECWLRFFRLDLDIDYPSFGRILLAACLFHDWGKANQGMQDVLTGSGSGQLFRHEHLSVMMLGYHGVEQWARQREDIDWDIVLAAVGSHHLKFGHAEFATSVPGETVRVWTEHDDFQSHLLPMISEGLNLAGSPRFPTELFWGYLDAPSVFNPTELRNQLRDGRLRKLTLACRDASQPKARMLNAVRSALIVADAVGSGLRRTETSIMSWVCEQFTEADLCDFPFVQSVILKRVEYLVSKGKWNGSRHGIVAVGMSFRRSVMHCRLARSYSRLAAQERL